MKINDVILQAITKLVVFMILTFAVFLFFSGHDNPGGGFVGGLVLAAALVLLFLAFDIETVSQAIPIDFMYVSAFGGFLVVASGLASVLLGEAFLHMTILQANLPLIGEFALQTVTIFEAGVALTVVGVVVTIILSISKGV